MWIFRWYFLVFFGEYRLLFSFPSDTYCNVMLYQQRWSDFIWFYINLKQHAYQLIVISGSFPLKSAFLYFMGNCASLIPDVSLLPGHAMICLPHLFCIMWHMACLGALLIYAVYLWDDQETNFLMTKVGGSHGSWHISIYCFTLEKSFTLFKLQHLKKLVSHQNKNSNLHALFISVCHGCPYWIMEFGSTLFHGNRVGFEL